jgi:hypothetical protein
MGMMHFVLATATGEVGSWELVLLGGWCAGRIGAGVCG